MFPERISRWVNLVVLAFLITWTVFIYQISLKTTICVKYQVDDRIIIPFYFHASCSCFPCENIAVIMLLSVLNIKTHSISVLWIQGSSLFGETDYNTELKPNENDQYLHVLEGCALFYGTQDCIVFNTDNYSR